MSVIHAYNLLHNKCSSMHDACNFDEFLPVYKAILTLYLISDINFILIAIYSILRYKFNSIERFLKYKVRLNFFTIKILFQTWKWWVNCILVWVFRWDTYDICIYSCSLIKIFLSRQAFKSRYQCPIPSSISRYHFKKILQIFNLVVKINRFYTPFYKYHEMQLQDRLLTTILPHILKARWSLLCLFHEIRSQDGLYIHQCRHICLNQFYLIYLKGCKIDYDHVPLQIWKTTYIYYPVNRMGLQDELLSTTVLYTC